MTHHIDVVVAIAVFASALIQGLSGVGFSLVAAPAITQAIPGAGAIGLVNFLALGQNSLMLWRENGQIHWGIIRRLLPGFIVGVVLGLSLSALVSDRWRPVVVAASSLASLAALLLWKPTERRGAAFIAASWGGTVNSYAGVGGPPIATYLIDLNLEQGDYIRTQQLCFAFLNVVSIPFLGIADVTVGWLCALFALVAAGTVVGRWTRTFLRPVRAHQASIFVIALVAFVALVHSLASLTA
jgi:uncharacterized membrane protein YfcA